MDVFIVSSAEVTKSSKDCLESSNASLIGPSSILFNILSTIEKSIYYCLYCKNKINNK